MSTLPMPESGKPNGLSDDALLEEINLLIQQSEILIARSQVINQAIILSERATNHPWNNTPPVNQQDNKSKNR